MNDEQLLRYARHLLLPEIGFDGQQAIVDAHVLLVGAGGLGCPAALYLASAGIGHLTVIDDDAVELSNLQRQIAHGMDTVGMPKAQSLREAIRRINPDVVVDAINRRVHADDLDTWVAEADVVLDCTDNFATRHAINQACVKRRKPLVSGAAIQFDAQFAVYHCGEDGEPCYGCVFPAAAQEVTRSDVHDLLEDRCATLGVFAPLTGIVGTLQAAEAIKLITGAGIPMRGRLVMLEARTMNWSELRIRQNPDCAICALSAAGAD